MKKKTITKKRKPKLSASSKLPGPGTKVQSFHSDLHQETIKGVSVLCKSVCRILDNIEKIESRLDRLELFVKAEVK